MDYSEIIIINVLCDLVGRYHDDGILILRPGGKEKRETCSFCLGVVDRCIVHWTPTPSHYA